MYLNSVTCLTLAFIYSVESYYVTLNHNGPIVIGGKIRLVAQLYDDNGAKPTGTFKFNWQDNAIPQHSELSKGDSSTSAWYVTYPKELYAPGEFEVQVQVSKVFPIFAWEIASARVSFNVTAFLNGYVDLIQNGTILGGNYINQKTEVTHQVMLNEADSELIKQNNTIIGTSYWFINCQYLGSSSDYKFTYNYTKDDVDKQNQVKVILVLGPVNNSTNISSLIFSNTTNEIENVTSVIEPTAQPPDIDICGTRPFVPTDPNDFYGFFGRNIIPTKPVHVDNVNGTFWLQNGELLHLNLTCSGSSPFYHCVRFIKGDYNSTGNETCKGAMQTQSCKISVTRLLSAGSHYTVLFIVRNRVSKTVTPVGVTMYREEKQPQLSVIIVPISCCSIAIVLIVFGIAYYIQSRNRYTIEVADFDFSKSNDTEYKTFKERLREAVGSAFVRDTEEYSEEGGPIGSVWSPTRKNRPPREGGLLFDSDSETVDS